MPMRKALSVILALQLLLTAGPAASAHTRSCGRPDLLFCEDFQSVPLGGATSLDWGVDTRHGTLTVQKAPRGQRVLHVHTEGNGHAFLRVDDFSAPGNSFYGRIRIRADAFPKRPDWAHYTLVEATGRGQEIVRPLGGQYVPSSGRALWGVGADRGPTGDWTNWRESAPSREDVWQCVEWRMDASDNRVELWFDGVAQPDLTVSTRSHGGNPVDFVFPVFDTVKFGWQLYQPNDDAHDLWLDDIALASRRVGC